MSKIEIDARRWNQDRGDETHRLNYNLNENSVYFDLGANTGEFAKKIYDRFGCRVYCFEPIRAIYAQLLNKFDGIQNAHCFMEAISTKNTSMEISVAGVASTFHKKVGSTSESVIVRRIDDVLRENNIDVIDLIKINIEGEEYDLLDFCLDQGLTSKFKNIQVQFHDFYPDAVERRNRIRERLSVTHSLTYNYEFTWENWELKQS